MKPTQRRSLANWMRERFQIAVIRACRLAGLSRTAWYKRSVAKDQSSLRMRIRDIAHRRPRFGYQRIHVMLRTEGWLVNKKRVRALVSPEGSQLRMRIRRRKHMCLHRGLAPQAQRTHERWSMDFVHDQLIDGRPFACSVIDQFSRLSPLVEPGFSFSGVDAAEALDLVIVCAGTPVSITVDHGTEFTSKALEEWVYRRGIKLGFTQPGKNTQNGHIESFNYRLRDECLNVTQLLSLKPAREQIERCRIDYNAPRPHSSFGNLTPSEFAKQRQANRTSAVTKI